MNTNNIDIVEELSRFDWESALQENAAAKLSELEQQYKEQRSMFIDDLHYFVTYTRSMMELQLDEHALAHPGSYKGWENLRVELKLRDAPQTVLYSNKLVALEEARLTFEDETIIEHEYDHTVVFVRIRIFIA